MQSALPTTSDLTRRQLLLPTSVPGRIFAAVSATAFVAVCAHLSFALPFTPVPLTLSNFAVLLVGLILGPAAGFSAMVLYLAEGAIGLPVFTPMSAGGAAHLIGPSAGYLFAYPLAAAIVGWSVRALESVISKFHAALAASVLASVPIFVLGAGWLAHLLHLSASSAWTLAIYPFLPGELIKVMAAAAVFSTLQRWRRS